MPASQPSSAPSLEYRRHHQVADPCIDPEHFHPGWRVQRRIDRLLLARALTLAEWRAATHFRNLVETAFGALLRAPDPERAIGTKGAPSARDRTAGLDRKLDSIAALRQVEQRLGGRIYELLTWCLVDDISWCAIGRRLGRDHKTARAWTIAALKALSAIL